MNPSKERWSIVLAGAWNTRLFSPAWLAQHVFGLQQIEIQFPDRAGLPYRFGARAVLITPTPDQVILSPLAFDDETLAEWERQALAILTTLVHTPLVAVGVNFGFVESAPGHDLLRLFSSLPDTGNLAATGYTVESTQISRRLSFGDEDVNFQLELAEGRVSADFNYHRQVTSSAEAADKLRGKIASWRNQSVTLLQQAYHSDVLADITE